MLLWKYINYSIYLVSKISIGLQHTSLAETHVAEGQNWREG